MPHIRASVPVYRDLARELRLAAEELHALNLEHKIFNVAAEDTILNFANSLDRLADLALDHLQPPAQSARPAV
ncbi:hypothetical protein [Methylobacterium sp. V23]|uniref:hypothetical protein n=1 Tax=Methylobacterium sp. V23 TaxID=2044878 RepID=UPI000CDAD95E|nr:hypothetical protein [Methylobacterium sp. V23]POR39928.1 hypothetical protein CRT23_26740 [Methylobacterium sp. V23]